MICFLGTYRIEITSTQCPFMSFVVHQLIQRFRRNFQNQKRSCNAHVTESIYHFVHIVKYP